MGIQMWVFPVFPEDPGAEVSTAAHTHTARIPPHKDTAFCLARCALKRARRTKAERIGGAFPHCFLWFCLKSQNGTWTLVQCLPTRLHLFPIWHVRGGVCAPGRHQHPHNCAPTRSAQQSRQEALRTQFLYKMFVEGTRGFTNRAGWVTLCTQVTCSLSPIAPKRSPFAPQAKKETAKSLRVGEACVNRVRSGSHTSSLARL